MSFGSLILGALNGLSYGLLALGVVLIYKSNRFLNLAYAQLGAAPALLLGKLVLQWGWSWWLALPVCLGFGIVLGVVVERVFIAWLLAKKVPAVSLLLLSIGVGQLLLALTFVPALGPGSDRIASRGYPVPFQAHVSVDGVVLGGPSILIAIAAPLLIAGLAVFLRSTMLGKQIRASASNYDAARLAGIPVRRLSTLTWGIGGGLASLTAILLAPSQGTFNAAALGPSLLLFALGSAAFGAFVSLGGALLGGLVLGVVEQLVLAQWHDAGDAEIAVTLLVLLAILIRGKAIGRVLALSGSVVQSTTRVRVPSSARDSWLARRGRPCAVAAASAVAILLPLLPPLRSESRRFELALIAMYALIALSFTVLSGWAGQVSLGQFSLVGVGAFVTARLAPHGLSLMLLVVLAGLAGMALLVVVGLPALRVPGLSLAVTSLGLAVLAPDWLLRQRWLGSDQPFGLQVTLPPVVRGISMPQSQLGVYYLGLALVALAVVVLSALRTSAIGRSLIAVRDNEQAAASFGLAPARAKLLALALSGFIAGAAGVLWSGAWRSAAATQFTPDVSMALLAAPVIGGVTSMGGSIAGAVAIYASVFFFSPSLSSLFGEFGQQIGFQLALGGAGVVLVLMLYPSGLAGLGQRCWQRLLDATARGYDRRSAEADGAVALQVSHVRVSFGGICALDGVDLEVRAGEIVGLIGANGAGKSTLMGVIAGSVEPSSGSVSLHGVELTDLPAEQRHRHGLARSFQDAALFAGMTVTQVVQTAIDSRHRAGVLATALRLPWARESEQVSRAEAAAVIERMGLSGHADTMISELSTGTRRICDLAAQTASRPKVLLLDEPTAGVAQREAERFGPLLREMRAELDCSILVIEHDMALLMQLCDRIYAMESGRVIAHGSPEQIRNDPAVIAAYLGADEAAIRRSGKTSRPQTGARASTARRRTPRSVPSTSRARRAQRPEEGL